MKKNVFDHAPGIKLPGVEQILLKMKLTLFVIMFSFLGAMATDSYSQTKLSLDLKNTTVRNALDAIENQSEFFFLYSEKIIDVNRRIDVEAQQSTVDKILDKIFSGTAVNYTVKDRQIILTTPDVNNLPATTEGSQQQKKVSGKVTDSSGTSLPGVSVVVKGTTIGVITDNEGKYSLSSVPQNATLQFSFVGMTMQEISVIGKTTVNCALSEDAIAIEEVVAIGYGTVKKVNTTSAISTVGKEFLKNKSFTSLEQGMQGIASGVQVTQNNSEPGGGVTVHIRGMSSISAGNDPLYVIDGVPFYNNPRDLNLQGYQQTGWNTTETAPPNSGMSAINPNDIESVQVLKDASATAIYGNRGANGVILITTKKGKAGEGNINFDVSYGLKSMTRPIGVIESQDYVTFNHEALDYYKSIGQTTTGLRLPDDASKVNTNWQKEATVNNALTSDYNLSFSGGNQSATYFIAGNYLNQDGIVPLTGFNRRSIRSNIDVKISDKFSGGMDMTASYTKNTNGYFNQGNIGTQYYSMSPVVPARNADGSLNVVNPYPGAADATNLFPSPIRSNDNTIMAELNTETFRTIGNLYLNYNILKNLTFRSSLGIDYINITRQQWMPKNTLYPQDNDAIGRAFVSNLKFPSYTWENRLNWDKTINNHVFGVTLAQSIEWRNRFSLIANTENFLDNTLKYNNMTAGSVIKPTQTSQSAWQLASFIGRVNYVEKTVKMTTYFQSKLTTHCRSKLTTCCQFKMTSGCRSKVTT